VPPKYRANVNIYAAIYNRREGAPAPLSDEEIDAIVAFLGTLTDAPSVSVASASSAEEDAAAAGGGAVARSPSREVTAR
jgi:hypothetical protein